MKKIYGLIWLIDFTVVMVGTQAVEDDLQFTMVGFKADEDVLRLTL